MLFPLRRLAIIAAAVALSTAPAQAQGQAPQVVASILPLHGLVAGVTEGVAGRPHLLVPPGASPHAYSLKPSDAAALSQADLVVWVGPGLESFLPSLLKTLPEAATSLPLAEAPGAIRHDQRSGALWGEHGHGDGHEDETHEEAAHGHEAQDHDAHGHDAHEEDAETAGTVDPHMWLDPRNAIAWTRAIADALAARDPANAAVYQRNAAGQTATLEALDAELAASLAPVADKPFLVFHDAYRYLEERYGLTAVGALALSPGRPAGARHLAEVRHRLEETGARCIFGEPQFSGRLAERVAAGTGARVRTLDPLGREQTRGADHYPALMRALVAELRGCLAAETEK